MGMFLFCPALVIFQWLCKEVADSWDREKSGKWSVIGQEKFKRLSRLFFAKGRKIVLGSASGYHDDVETCKISALPSPLYDIFYSYIYVLN